MSNDELAGIHARLDTIIERLNGMREECARRGERGTKMAADLIEIKSAIWGNGQPGLKSRLEKIETERAVSYKWLGVWLGVAGVLASIVAVVLDKVLG